MKQLVPEIISAVKTGLKVTNFKMVSKMKNLQPY